MTERVAPTSLAVLRAEHAAQTAEVSRFHDEDPDCGRGCPCHRGAAGRPLWGWQPETRRVGPDDEGRPW